MLLVFNIDMSIFLAKESMEIETLIELHINAIREKGCQHYDNDDITAIVIYHHHKIIMALHNSLAYNLSR